MKPSHLALQLPGNLATVCAAHSSVLLQGGPGLDAHLVGAGAREPGDARVGTASVISDGRERT